MVFISQWACLIRKEALPHCREKCWYTNVIFVSVVINAEVYISTVQNLNVKSRKMSQPKTQKSHAFGNSDNWNCQQLCFLKTNCIGLPLVIFFFSRTYLVPNLGISLLLRGQRIKDTPVGYKPRTSSLQMRCSYQLSYRGPWNNPVWSFQEFN